MSAYANMAIPPPLSRASTVVVYDDPLSHAFEIGPSKKSYKFQYSNIYFIRLHMLRGTVESQAHRKWMNISGDPILIPRVLEVEKGRLCYVVGTVYMDMPLKPNVIEDIARDQSIPPPPPPPKYCSPEDSIMLEDESGRIKLVGDRLKDLQLVTGIVIGALGMETPNGEFEVIDICFPDMAPQSTDENATVEDDRMDVDGDDKSGSNSSDEWIAVVSGFDFGSPSCSDGQVQLLVEYLTGEGNGVDDQISASQISRLIVAGDSLAPVAPEVFEPTPAFDDKRTRRSRQEQTSFSTQPLHNLNATLNDIAASMPIHILPGESDPAGTIMPQQPFPRAMFGEASRFSTLSCETNPKYLTLASDPEASTKPTRPLMKRKLLINSGQPLNDMFKYLPSPPNTHLSLLESTLRWRHMAPTAPDTLWCHPYLGEDPFVIAESPDIYIVGGQKHFGTKMVTSHPDSLKQKGKPPTRCRIILVPSFARTGTLVLVNLRTLAVKCVNFGVHGMTAGGKSEIEEAPANPPSPAPIEPLLSAPRSSFDYGLH